MDSCVAVCVPRRPAQPYSPHSITVRIVGKGATRGIPGKGPNRPPLSLQGQVELWYFARRTAQRVSSSRCSIGHASEMRRPPKLQTHLAPDGGTGSLSYGDRDRCAAWNADPQTPQPALRDRLSPGHRARSDTHFGITDKARKIFDVNPAALPQSRSLRPRGPWRAPPHSRARVVRNHRRDTWSRPLQVSARGKYSTRTTTLKMRDGLTAKVRERLHVRNQNEGL